MCELPQRFQMLGEGRENSIIAFPAEDGLKELRASSHFVKRVINEGQLFL
jgi:hypothetical protein